MARVDDISTITDLELYLEELDSIKSGTLIAIAVRDTAGFHLSAETAAALRKLGIGTDLHGKHGHAYGAVIEMGEAVVDRLSAGNETINERLELQGHQIALRSAVYVRENVAEIKIDDVDYSVGSRGLNIVVFDLVRGIVLDSVGFDTHTRANACYRTPDMLKYRLDVMERSVQRVERTLKGIGRSLERLERGREVDSARSQMMAWHGMSELPHDPERAKRAFFRALPPAKGVIRKMQMAGLVLLLEFDRIAKENGITWFLGCGNLLGAVRANEFIPWDDDTDIYVPRSELPKIRDAYRGNPDFYFDEFYSVRDEGATNMNCVYQIHFAERNTPYSLDLFIVDYSETLDAELVERTREVHKQMGDAARRVCLEIHGREKKTERHTEDGYRRVFEEHYEMIKPCYGNQDNWNYLVWGIDNVPSWTGMNTFFPKEWIFPLGEIELAGHRFPAPAFPEKVVTRVYEEPWTIPDDMFTHQHFNITEERERILDGLLVKYADLLGDRWDFERDDTWHL